MEDKKQYIKPTVKCVEFKSEIGFAMSQGFNLNNNFGNYNGYDSDDARDAATNGNRFGGFFTNNTDDWD